MKQFLIAAILILLTTLAPAQKKLDEAINTYYTQWHKGQPTSDISESLLSMDYNIVFSKLEHHTTDSTEDNRYATYRLIDYLGVKSKNPAIRQRAVKQIIRGCRDRDGGIIGLNLQNLTRFSRDDFDNESKYFLSEIAKKPIPHYELLIKICGWLNITDLIYDFRQMINEKKGTERQRWTMRLAIARMNEQDMQDYCFHKIQNVTINEDVIYDMVPDIIYTRQKPMFDYLLKAIESDEKTCHSPNPNLNIKIVCAFRIIEQIAPYIQNFPATISKSGELRTKNYEETLSEVRSWIKLNRDRYVIIKETF